MGSWAVRKILLKGGFGFDMKVVGGEGGFVRRFWFALLDTENLCASIP